MRILIAGQAFYRQDNGQATFTVRIAEGLAQAGHQIWVLAPSEKRQPYRRHLNGVTLQTVPAVHLGFNVNVSAFSEGLVTSTLIECNPDIVHIQDHYFLSRVVLKVAQKFHIPVVGTNHFLPDNLTDNFLVPEWAKRPLHRWLWHTMLSVFNQLDAATTPTQTAVDILSEQEIHIPLQPISCGVDTHRFHPRPDFDPTSIYRKYGLAGDKTIFLFVGRVDREKNIDVLIKALAALNNPTIQFAVAGKGSHLGALKRLAADLGLTNEQLRFLGFVPDEDLPYLLNSVTYFAMPSHAELQSIATLEAMSSGLPVLAADARALPELVEHQLNGYLFAAGDIADAKQGLIYLAERRAEWPFMSRVSLQKAEKHALQNSIRAYSQWYRHYAYQPETLSVHYQ